MNILKSLQQSLFNNSRMYRDFCYGRDMRVCNAMLAAAKEVMRECYKDNDSTKVYFLEDRHVSELETMVEKLRGLRLGGTAENLLRITTELRNNELDVDTFCK